MTHKEAVLSVYPKAKIEPINYYYIRCRKWHQENIKGYFVFVPTKWFEQAKSESEALESAYNNLKKLETNGI